MSKDIYKEVIFNREEYREQLAYWSKIITADLTAIDLPVDFKSPGREEKADTNKKNVNNFLPVNISKEQSSRLLKFSKNTDLTLYVVLLAGIKIFLNKCCQSDEIVIVTPLLDLDQNLKKYVKYNNRILFRDFVDRNLTFKEVLIQTKNQVIEVYENQNYPLDLVFKKKGLTIDHFSFLNRVAFLLKNLQDEEEIINLNHDLLFYFEREGSDIHGNIRYNQQLFKKETIKGLSEKLLRIFDTCINDVNRRLKDLEILSAQEKERLLFHFNSTKADYPRNKTIHRLVEEQEEKTPDHVAVVFIDSALTYKKLNQESNRLAKLLQQKGVTAESIIAIMMDNSLEMIISILAVLKAGPAYLPIDPAYPQERILFMLKDSHASVLLTKERSINDLSFISLRDFEASGVTPLVTASRPQIKDLDSIQVPDRSLVDYDRYTPFIGQSMVKNAITLQFSRGCVFNCAYCFKIWPKNYVTRSAENLFAELLFYYKLGIRRYAFVDDLPNLNVKESSKFYQLIIDHGLKVHLHYPNGIKGDILTREYIDLMVEAGTVDMDMALETTSPRLQKLIRKNLNIEKLQENIQYIIDKYPHVLLELQILHGIPSETREEAKKSLEFMKNLKWIDFPYIHILKIGLNSDMAKIAREHGISKEAIKKSAEMFVHELPDTLPFPKEFTQDYKAEFVNEYFMAKERLLKRLPYQMNVLTEDELVQKYNSYLPIDIKCFADLLDYAGIGEDEIKGQFLPGDYGVVPLFNRKLKENFPIKKSQKNALRILLLDLSHFFSTYHQLLYDVSEPPLGLMYLMTYLNRRLGSKIIGKLAKSRRDFDSYDELEKIIRDFKPEVIGIRSLNVYREFFHQTVSLLVQWEPGVPIIAGGPYATSDYEEMLKDSNVDLAVLGEGEVTMAELIEKIIENNKKLPGKEVLKTIPGIAFIEDKDKWMQKAAHREIICLDRLSGSLLPETLSNPGSINKTSDLAYIIYTSGSTGNPKGVMIQHNSLTNQIIGLRKRFALDASPNYLLLAAFTFDVSLMHIFLALTTGAKLFLIKEETKKDSTRLWGFINEKGIDILNIVPAFMTTLLKTIEFKKLYFNYLFVGGDVFTKNLYSALTESFSVKKLINIYGPTETTINATLYECSDKSGDGIPGETVPIGKPLTNYSVFILDQDLNPVPIGVKGELCISGPGQARGYLNRPELTAEKFLTVSSRSYRSSRSYISKKIYKTGDLARWLPGGNIEFLGRIDFQVKVRGYRIELGEIENQLLQKQGIKQAVVIDRSDRSGDKYICAYIVPDIPGEMPAELGKYLSQRLPRYMVPAYFECIKEIPLTASGKVDKKALPVPGLKREDDYEAPRDALEEKLAEIWAEVVGIGKDNIGIDFNFFELGGHSLKATILGAKIHKELNIKIPLPELFQTPTIRGLAGYIRKAAEEKFLPLEPAEKKDYYNLSSVQRRLYFLQQFDVKNLSYNLPMVVLLQGDIEFARLEMTFKKLVERHESFRTFFEMIEGEPIQRIQRDVDLKIEYYHISKVELGETPGAQVKREFPPTPGPTGEIIKNFVRPFDLSRAPLMRIGFRRIGETQHVLIMDMHHIIIDGTSFGVVCGEFMAVYGEQGLPGLRLQYKDYSEWQNRDKSQQKELFKKQGEYWQQVFSAEVPVLNLPTDYSRFSVQSFEGFHRFFEIASEQTRALNELAAQEGATLFMVLLALYNIFLSKLSGQEDIVVGTSIAGRRHADLNRIIGMFVNALAMRNYPASDKTFREFLLEVKEQTLKAYENQEYPFEYLVEKAASSRDASRNPLFDTMLVLNNEDVPEVTIPGLKLKPYTYENTAAQFDLKLRAVEIEEKLRFRFEVRARLFREETIDLFIKNFKKIVSMVIKDTGIHLKDIHIFHDLKSTKSTILKEDQGDFGF
ncbi:MAG: amino acid adenylation domain-containing protein [Candidatus Aminicenantes bacterium]|nr:MAG: amino acid adenylation domain-containing protein [Candidatus Aminicenantes bacterium]